MTRIFLLAVVAVCSALAVVYAKYRTRMLFAEVQRLELALDQYEVELGQLQLEQNTWAEHGRIEHLARSRLGMILPARESIIYIKP
ncbi:cell division protein FtsL [Methylococcus capsulatus]|jgi:cell division protein FtsL|uniref:Cell division protein FtsL n=1 Tax=Methylococcus capsulatus (strain ATCC 33009 / NCIMB 11132 / Bath) TaxID=243233 RepID=Q604V1_METCA|nr:cell division protein FtsL [Methylococcus capsulatus]AAU91464.1 putative cell division protein FtsL [Methylococcus capsulatus str. Bath]QXP86992.1 cell division protein FtsL [Methylococcus capsulatus]QXP93328.1 cell division protein FtsL [Methylococcus capsulatus]UQN11973.1 cell division protein FtsL [Methylococcus capsulatus]